MAGGDGLLDDPIGKDLNALPSIAVLITGDLETPRRHMALAGRVGRYDSHEGRDVVSGIAAASTLRNCPVSTSGWPVSQPRRQIYRRTGNLRAA